MNTNLINLKSNELIDNLVSKLTETKQNFSYLSEDIKVVRALLQSVCYAYEDGILEDEDMVYCLKGISRDVDEIEQMVDEYFCESDSFEEVVING